MKVEPRASGSACTARIKSSERAWSSAQLGGDRRLWRAGCNGEVGEWAVRPSLFDYLWVEARNLPYSATDSRADMRPPRRSERTEPIVGAVAMRAASYISTGM